MTWSLRTGAALAAGLLAAGAAGAAPEDGSPGWWEPPAETPIADSIEPAVERYVREHFTPCALAGSAVPCFPVSVEVQGRVYSVRETLDNLQLDDRPVPGTLPTAEEMIQHGANPHPASGSVAFDPAAIACKTRQLLKKVQGKSTTYYLYRVWDRTGERAVLRDRPLDPEALAADPQFHYEPLGEFGDECQAIKAYRHRTHDLRLRREAEPEEDGVSTAPEH
jgi:hypothetical protein